MTDEQSQPVAWNEEARISCAFAFKCPKVWNRLQPTSEEGVRHCPACDRDVYLARTEEDFRRYADEGQCVAVRVLAPDPSEEAEPSYVFGRVRAPYGVGLRRV